MIQKELIDIIKRCISKPIRVHIQHELMAILHLNPSSTSCIADYILIIRRAILIFHHSPWRAHTPSEGALIK